MNYDTYLSVFTWRYGSTEMREIWSEVYKRRLWRRLWVALADAQCQAGLVRREQVEELRRHQDDIDVEGSHAIEAEIRHDLMAEVRMFASQCPEAGGIIHLGATSMDIVDNADAMRLRDSLDIVLNRLEELLQLFVILIEGWLDEVCMAHTHIQPAEPTTVGYRLSQYAQDLMMDFVELRRVRDGLRAKGFKGAVGTSASYVELLGDTGISPQEMEAHIMKSVGMEAFAVTTQTYPRKQDWLVLNALAGLAGSIYKFALDLRVLQAPSFGEWAEPFGSKQVGSSAMPFKRNPIRAERLCSLGRQMAAMPRVAWDNAAHSILERTLDDSANRRTVMPESFLLMDEMLRLTIQIVRDLQLDQASIARHLAVYGAFSALERVLMTLGRRSADRQEMHEILREHAMQAWQQIREGKLNPLIQQVCADERLLRYLDQEEILGLMDVQSYVGDAPQRSRQLVAQLLDLLGDSA